MLPVHDQDGVVMTGTDWNDDVQGEQAGASGEQHLPSEPAASASTNASGAQDVPPSPPAAYQGTPADAHQGTPGDAYGPPAGDQGMAAGAWPGQATGSDTVEFGQTATAATAAGAATGRPRRTRLVIASAAGAVVAVAVAAIAIAAAGGGGGSSSQSPAQVLAAAAHKSAAVNSLSATYSEQISGLASGSITGAVQEIRKPLQMSIGMTETIEGQTIPLSAILTDNTMYMKFGTMTGLPSSLVGKWIEFPLSGLAGGTYSSLLQSVQNENPASQTQELLAAKHLRADGTQVIDGVQTTRYTGSFTPAAALKVLSPKERTALAPAMKQISGLINFSVWIDGNDLIRKFTEHETVASETVNVTFTFQSFNQSVNVTIPPASQVIHYPGSGL
jgi:hypothetical protein